ncbi:RNA polymerase sigma factor [Citricoccus sp. NR2]|uniref:RNA polymerase sigma factor n=1 Tax=Citricoccus sp. NR2 TaxID=3004095 RepID=UPI0022DE6B09|nr:RNA polymerase sigma factor [Citricoccus sp. NR2]WBL18806.1 RNA polymerase sigma factor [Citricoccus sp. NR2]
MKALERALVKNDVDAARRLSREAVDAGAADDALALLARHARDRPADPLAAETFLETLDATGVVRRFAGGALLDQSAVDDVSQEALISIAASLGSYTGQSKVTTWVHSIVRRRVVDHLRRQRSTAPLTEELSPAARMSSVIATRVTVQQALDALPDLYREPVVLRDLQGHSYTEIAERLDRPVGTVKAQINRGRALVAAGLRGDDDGAGA